MIDLFVINSKKKKSLLVDGMWLLSQHGFKFVVSFFVTVFLARYLGPENYGLFSLSIAYILIFAIFSDLGISNILVRDLVIVEKKEALLSTAFILRILGGIISIIFLVSFLNIFPQSSIITKSLLILAPILIFKSFNSFSDFFQSINKNKYLSIATIVSILIGGALTYVFIILEKSYFDFVFVYLLEFVILSLLLWVFYISVKNRLRLKFDKIIAKKILNESWPLIIAGASSIISTRVDQIFIGNMLSESVLGNYSVAAKISEVWLILPMIYGRVVYPTLVEKRRINFKNYKKIIFSTISLFFVFGLFGASLITYLSKDIISILFGDQYNLASLYLSFYIWSTLPYFTLFVLSQIFYIEKITRYVIIVSISSIILNILLNYFLINLYGALGAIIGTLIATIVSYLLTFIIIRFKTDFFK
tara:strand:+ start:3072 stop:4328 length:1257 start_codon:yes stop_codon:yes gene_type:complete